MLTAKRLSTFSLALVLAGFLGQASWAQDFGDFDQGVGAGQDHSLLQTDIAAPAPEGTVTNWTPQDFDQGVGAGQDHSLLQHHIAAPTS